MFLQQSISMAYKIKSAEWTQRHSQEDFSKTVPFKQRNNVNDKQHQSPGSYKLTITTTSKNNTRINALAQTNKFTNLFVCGL